MLISQEQLHEMLPYATDRDIGKFYLPLIDAMKEFCIDTPLRIAAFVAQIGHESGSLRYVEEIASGKAYEHREDLGNLDPLALIAAHANHSTTGVFYKGRGLIQITGYTNYVACCLGLGIDCIRNPKLLKDPINACRSAAWFWSSKELNKKADLGLFDEISRKINGGSNGKEERRALYKRCLEVLGC
jgi:putative chitinase